MPAKNPNNRTIRILLKQQQKQQVSLKWLNVIFSIETHHAHTHRVNGAND